MADTYPQQCGVRIPGKPPVFFKAGPQFCEPLAGGGFRPFSFNNTDPCGVPFACSTTARVVLQPTCYSLPTDPPGCPRDAFVRLTVAADCSIARGPVVDEDNQPIASATEVICSPRSSFPTIPAP